MNRPAQPPWALSDVLPVLWQSLGSPHRFVDFCWKIQRAGLASFQETAAEIADLARASLLHCGRMFAPPAPAAAPAAADEAAR